MREDRDVWIVDLVSGRELRFTTDYGSEDKPVWSPDGSRLAYIAPSGIEARSTVGGGREERVGGKPGAYWYPTAWMPDGRALVHASIDPKTGFDIMFQRLDGDRAAVPLVHSPFDETQGQVSPDGRWLAYVSDETGRNEVYVRSVSSPDDRRPISAGGAIEPNWRRDGRELFYLAADGWLTAVDVRPGPTLEIGVPTRLFKTQMATLLHKATRNQYAVSGDGRRFLVNQPAGPPPVITVLVNWAARVNGT